MTDSNGGSEHSLVNWWRTKAEDNADKLEEVKTQRSRTRQAREEAQRAGRSKTARWKAYRRELALNAQMWSQPGEEMYQFPRFLLPISCTCSHWVNAIHSCQRGSYGCGPDVNCLPDTGELEKGAEWGWEVTRETHPSQKESGSSYSRQGIQELADLSDCILQLQK